MKEQRKARLNKLITIIGWPVHILVELIHHFIPVIRFPHSRKAWNCIIGIVVMIFGSWVARELGNILGDTIGFAIHGIGLAPIVRIIENYIIE